MEAFWFEASSRVSAATSASFVLLHNVTLLKDFCNSSLINFFLVYTHQTSLCLSLPSLSHSSSPFVRLRWPYRWQYRLWHQCIGTKSWGERWGKGEEIWDKTRRIERRGERESVLPRACQLFYYCDVCAFITMPANKKSLKVNGAAATETLLNGERAWTLIWSARHLSIATSQWKLARVGKGLREDGSPCWPCAGWKEGEWTASGCGQCHTRVQGEICGQAED